MKKFIYATFLIVAVFLLASCNSIKEVAYVQDVQFDVSQEITQKEIRIMPNDVLNIMVNSSNPEMSLPFNMPMVAYQMTSNGFASGAQRILGYVVDSKGEIDFPVLGKLMVKGLTRRELGNMIKDKLAESGMLKDAVVTIQFQNFKISVLGEVVSPRTINVDSDRITIFEAISAAGDMTVYGRRDKVVVIREENDRRVAYVNDLRNAKIFDSPCYYLQQNDVVYVEPNRVKAGQRNINQNTTISTWVSLASLLTTIAVLIFK